MIDTGCPASTGPSSAPFRSSAHASGSPPHTGCHRVKLHPALSQPNYPIRPTRACVLSAPVTPAACLLTARARLPEPLPVVVRGGRVVGHVSEQKTQVRRGAGPVLTTELNSVVRSVVRSVAPSRPPGPSRTIRGSLASGLLRHRDHDVLPRPPAAALPRALRRTRRRNHDRHARADRRLVIPRALRLVLEWAGEHPAESTPTATALAPTNGWSGSTRCPSIWPMVAVTAVEPLADYTLRLSFDDGSERVVDLADELWGPMGEPLGIQPTSDRSASTPRSGRSSGRTGSTSTPMCCTAVARRMRLPRRRTSRPHRQFSDPTGGRLTALRIASRAAACSWPRHLNC